MAISKTRLLKSKLILINPRNNNRPLVRPTPTKRQLVASWCATPNLAPSLMASGGSYTANQVRNAHKIGRANIKDLRIQDIQARLTPGSGAEVASPAATSIWRRAIEIGSTTYPATYSGAISKDLVSGGLIETDNIVGAFALANSQIFTRGTRTVKNATTGVFDPALDNINGVNMVGPSSQGFRTVGGAQVNSVGAMNASGSGGGNAVWPWMITGIPDVPMAACRVIGDSIAQYLNDTNTGTTGGYIKRGLNNINGETFVWQFAAVDANKMQLQTPALAPLQWVNLDLLTCVILQCITNDIAANRTLAAIKADFISIATAVKNTIGPYGLPLLMVAVCCLNRGTFTGAQNTVKNDYNNWILSGADGYCDVAIDMRPYQGDPNSYPSDTIHPGQTDHANMAPYFAAAMAPMLDPYWVPPNYVRLAPL
ncbi:SGNH/GDSL hydrolase family protein [Rhizobium phage RHph_TM39]|uniref:SGNH/GDSL hydrolase family protein n=2 Tax=Cuauhnahuacvirus TaxID=3044696 RepID=A0A7S5RCB1_9CAUD|nr:SGNH/GDSL hydrolase family protein [Rhizobium phage RHph_TM30]YP_010671462.1 SGNH/GDSL hydrolase family protein [Rhizobium phage RHph_Y65]QIG71785.1 SGNH/GDSL hydrolase family protein [Rhizobium phage RHph_TM40]QIG72146.1 SGNH/GDSL hydrolase family protein [Rhizobium phage RHph_TM2_3B]QIG72508.1 SGNH/GDSL hydrolase family protein [Rhizobium phage RHph_TM3_3_6]QIG77281.1 SGNH/GDSL hydrolase family protein [Rhizobium phage RHph_TM39]QIG77898.1 SGNH/GDSL hydrolase family protein [Rhizobium ph